MEQSCQPHDMQLSETYEKNEIEATKIATCLW